MPDLMDEFEQEKDLLAEFENEPDVAQAAPSAPKINEVAPQAKVPVRQKTDLTDSAARGAGQGFTLGFGDEATGAIQALGDSAIEDYRALQRGFSEGDWRAVDKRFGRERFDRFMREYRAARDSERRKNTRAADDHPAAYGISQAVSALPLTIATGGSGGAGVTAGLGAAQSLGASDSDLTHGDAGAYLDAADDMAKGAMFGYVGGKIPVVGKYVMPAVGAGLAAFGDEFGMSEADRWAAGTGAVLSLPGMAGDALEGLATRAGRKAAPAREQVTRQVEAEDFANDVKDAHTMNRTANKLLQADEEARLDAVRKVREQENETHAAAKGEAKAQRQEELEQWQQDREGWQQERDEARAARAEAKEQRNQERQAALDERKQAILAQQAHEEGSQAVKGHQRATKDANREYLRRLGEKDDEIRAYEKVWARQAREEADLEAAVAKAETELASVEESAKQAANKHFDTLDVRARRAADTYERRGMPVPEEVQTARDFVDDSYLENTPGRLSMPEVVRQNFIARERPAREAALKAAQEALANYRANKPDVEQQVRDLLGRKGTRVSKGEAYQLAQELGLNAGTLETFEPIPPKGGWQLTEPAPPEAPPAPDMTALKLKAIERQQAALQGQDTGPSTPAPRKPAAAPLPEMARKPEAEILAEAGLDQPKPLTPRLELKADVDTRRPVAERVDEWINNAREPAMSEIRGKALTGSLPGGVATAALPFKAAGGAATVLGGLLGARNAIRHLSRVNPRTGEFENPAAVAAVYESLQRVLAKYPALAKKYVPGFRNGLSAVQTMFYIDEDPELAKALDEDAAEQARR